MERFKERVRIEGIIIMRENIRVMENNWKNLRAYREYRRKLLYSQYIYQNCEEKAFTNYQCNDIISNVQEDIKAILIY